MEGAAVSARVRRLPEEVVRRIAAGEVIERPASVLKELLENSLDAGATRVQVETLGAGRKLLRVTDDGSGMGPEDCRLAFERHATSKIAEPEDLERLVTFGFRGEALFSIAAVSRVALSSCPRGGRGWSVRVEGGRRAGERESPPVAGTTVEVSDLFFNTPARLKFLKSDASERGHLARVVEEAALAHPGVAFAHKSEGRFSLQLPALRDQEAGLRSRVASVLGDELAEGLLETAEEAGGVRLRAFLAPAESLSPARGIQHFFVNRRPVSSRLLSQALYRAYEPFRPRGRHPVAVVYLKLAPDRFDANVHPAKREVRFREERPLFELLSGALSATLLRSKGIPALTRGAPAARGAPAPRSGAPSVYSRPAEAGPGAPATLELLRDLPGPAAAGSGQRWYTPPFRFLGQVEAAYLVFEASGGLLVVDQHAAQERVLFERFLREVEQGRVRSQKLLLPVSVELPASRAQQVLARAGRLKRLGFELAPFGKGVLHVRAAPALFRKARDLKEMVHRLLESLESEGEAAGQVQRDALATIACKAAVKAHDRLGPEEALRLLEDLKSCRDGTACPHGRPSMISLNRDELARRFKRPGAPPL